MFMCVYAYIHTHRMWNAADNNSAILRQLLAEMLQLPRNGGQQGLKLHDAGSGEQRRPSDGHSPHELGS